MSERGKITYYYTSRGLRRYEINIWHDGLGERQTIRGINRNDVWQKAKRKMQQWVLNYPG